MRSIAFIDLFGQPYDGKTLLYKGLGGSESSVIRVSRELAQLGYKVYVFNSCTGFNDIAPGEYDGVEYKSKYTYTNEKFDIVISVRSVYPFTSSVKQSVLDRGLNLPLIKIQKDTLKILWRHDTYFQGDDYIPELVRAEQLDEIFTLSDFHTKHLKDSFGENLPIYQTENGIQLYNIQGAIRLAYNFCYNAAHYKGLEQLLTIWPTIKNKVPEAKLTVIGGYYNDIFDSNFYAMQAYLDNKMSIPGVEFKGVIPPDEAALIMTSSCAMLYPCVFPETFGISCREAMSYGTPVITTRLGALNELSGPVIFMDDLNPNTWTEIIEKLLKNDTFYDALSKASVKTKTWKEVAQDWDEHFYLKLLRSQGPVTLKTKSILIAVPTARYIEPETFKSIYELEIPNGYRADFRFFFGYLIDQTRNYIANHAIECGYDYVLAVDSDIIVPPDALKKMLSHDKPLVSGMYRMRRPEQVIEIYNTKYWQMNSDELIGQGLVEIGGCGFGCVLVKTEVFKAVGYPQFKYHQAYRFDETFSEDNDFCKKAIDKGFKLYCDTSILCKHKGTIEWEIKLPPHSN